MALKDIRPVDREANPVGSIDEKRVEQWNDSIRKATEELRKKHANWPWGTK